MPLYLRLAEPINPEVLDGRTFQLHVLNDSLILLYAVEIAPLDCRCPVIVHGERCGRPAGHEGKHIWANGD